MLYISDNLKYLRNRKKLSQPQVAEEMKLGLDRYKKYEYGKNVPPAETLVLISRFYHISIDLLLTVDLQKIQIDNLLKLDDNRIVFPIKVNSDGENLIEVIPHKAKAGYTSGYADYEFVNQLPTMHFPNLGLGKHRAFPIEGDSMPPHTDKSFIIGKYIENLGELRKGKTYILVTADEGIVYKRLAGTAENHLEVESDNVIYSPYSVKLSDVLEIWEYAGHFGSDDRKLETPEAGTLQEMFLELKQAIKEIKKN